MDCTSARGIAAACHAGQVFAAPSLTEFVAPKPARHSLAGEDLSLGWSGVMLRRSIRSPSEPVGDWLDLFEPMTSACLNILDLHDVNH
jgi:hypothetical protein